jgi:catechol 2,3-dioxygenase-like lactoylglutathione lyase family enzyme
MDNVGIVVDDLAATIDFFRELGLDLEGQATIEGEWAGRVTGLGDQRVEIAMMRTPDGHGRLELSRFLTPPAVADHRNAPVNALGYLRVMFAVDDIDETLERLRKRGAQLVSEVVQYKDAYRLCYIRGPEGLLIGLVPNSGGESGIRTHEHPLRCYWNSSPAPSTARPSLRSITYENMLDRDLSSAGRNTLRSAKRKTAANDSACGANPHLLRSAHRPPKQRRASDASANPKGCAHRAWQKGATLEAQRAWRP